MVKENDLETVLRSLYARDKNLEVAVVLEPGVAREKAARVLEVAKAVGITKVAVQPVPPLTR